MRWMNNVRRIAVRRDLWGRDRTADWRRISSTFTCRAYVRSIWKQRGRGVLLFHGKMWCGVIDVVVA